MKKRGAVVARQTTHQRQNPCPRIQTLRLRLSALGQFIAAWPFEAQRQTLLTVEAVDSFVIIAPAFPHGPVGAKLQNATSDFFELDLSKNHLPVKWLL
ncbi:Uncharacterised protein [Serratia grimesii]|nr:pilA-like protein [Serratia grimesii]CAI2793428.1 Uncharacterised protein [Serratia grimesii]